MLTSFASLLLSIDQPSNLYMAPSWTKNTSTCTLKIVEESHVFLPCPPATTSQHPHSLPLTFLDIPWLQFPPIQPLFFFQLTPHDNIHNLYKEFNSTILPTLKHSLSSALQQFYPFAGKLSVANDHHLVFSIRNQSSDSVAVTVATCEADLDELCSYNPKSAHLFPKLVPSLPNISSVTLNSKPAHLLAIRITLFPSISCPGFSIGFASYPVLCDQRTFSNFLYSWASFSKFGNNEVNGSYAAATFDRSVILDTVGLQPTLFKQWLGLKPNKMNPSSEATTHGLVRSTFVMGPTDIDDARQWILAQCDKLKRPYPVLLSPYVVTCAFVWTCFLEAQVQHISLTKAKTKGPMYFGFIAGGVTRLPYRVPTKYFGNCVGFGRAVAQREQLLRQDVGLLAAADAIGLTVKKLDGDILGGAGKWISDWEELIGSEAHIHVIGSPKVKLYETDFGWGRPKKIEEISIDGSKAISLVQSRDMNGGIEIGLTQPNYIISAFSTLFTQGLRDFAL